jgi:hypothetical protein
MGCGEKKDGEVRYNRAGRGDGLESASNWLLIAFMSLWYSAYHQPHPLQFHRQTSCFVSSRIDSTPELDSCLGSPSRLLML